MNPRLLFRPKLQELKVQCDSCPFRTGNDKKLATILNMLRKKYFLRPLKGKEDIKFARRAVHADIAIGGDFACHHTAYNKDGTLKPKSELRQCPGATQAYRDASPIK